MKNNDIFDKLFEYGYHDTSFRTFEAEEVSRLVKIGFGKGLYILGEDGRELKISDPLELCLKISDFGAPLEDFIEIRLISGKARDMEYKELKALFMNAECEIEMLYYSNFDSAVLIRTWCEDKNIMISISGIEDVFFNRISFV